jgi:Ion channel
MEGNSMMLVGFVAAIALIVIVLIDAFEVVLLPRRIRHGFRLARRFYRTSWMIGRTVAQFLPPGRRRTGFLSAFGPLSLFVLVVIWAAGLITGFGLLHWSLGTRMSVDNAGIDTYLYFSGSTFFTLGYGDVVATSPAGRVLCVTEAGMGFVFLAVIVSYLPVLYQAFSRREIAISLFDARAGSPPSAGELLRRLAESRNPAGSSAFLVDWERWAADLLESHLSFPVLGFYRSQHENQSWVAALTTILDTSALLIAGIDGPDGYQARLTFAMARHAAVDLSLVFQTTPLPPHTDRLPEADFTRLQDSLRVAGMNMRDGSNVLTAIKELRGLYEPFVNALAAFFLFALPPFQPERPPVDNWQTSPGMPRSPGLGSLMPTARAGDEHFD